MDSTNNAVSDFIPHIEEMLNKEEKHLQFLKDTKEKINSFPKLGWINPFFGDDGKELKRMIHHSQFMVAHFTLRLKEYKAYLKNLTNKRKNESMKKNKNYGH